MLRLLSTLFMPVYGGLPLPPVPGDWAALPECAREADPYRACPLLTTSKAAAGAALREQCVGSGRIAPVQTCPRPKPTCAPALHRPFSAFGGPPKQSARNVATDENQAEGNIAGDAWMKGDNCKASCSPSSALQASKRLRIKKASSPIGGPSSETNWSM